MDREAAIAAIADEAKRQRKRLPRWVWIAAFAVAAACLGGLAIAWLQDRDTPAERHLTEKEQPSSGFTLGLIVGAGAGLAIGAFAFNRRR